MNCLRQCRDVLQALGENEPIMKPPMHTDKAVDERPIRVPICVYKDDRCGVDTQIKSVTLLLK